MVVRPAGNHNIAAARQLISSDQNRGSSVNTRLTIMEPRINQPAWLGMALRTGAGSASTAVAPSLLLSDSASNAARCGRIRPTATLP